jgi:DNA-binding protein HU-beta
MCGEIFFTCKGGVFLMTKAELVAAVQAGVAKKYDLSKAAVEAVVDAAFDNVAKAIKKEKRFAYPGFGVFAVRQRKARKGRNPRTGEVIKIKASKSVGFKAAPALKKGL